jgi:FtsH-binding integral membrane protein
MTTNPTTRTALLGTCTALGGMTLTPAMLMYSAVDPTIVPVAFALSCLVFAGSTAGALMMPKRSMMVYAPVLGGGAFIIFGVSLLSMFWPHPILYNVWLYGGLALSTAFVAYDTQSAIEGCEVVCRRDAVWCLAVSVPDYLLLVD